MPITKIVANKDGGVISTLAGNDLVQHNTRVEQHETDRPVRELKLAIAALKQNETHDRLVEAILDKNGGLNWLQNNRQLIDENTITLNTITQENA